MLDFNNMLVECIMLTLCSLHGFGHVISMYPQRNAAFDWWGSIIMSVVKEIHIWAILTACSISGPGVSCMMSPTLLCSQHHHYCNLLSSSSPWDGNSQRRNLVSSQGWLGLSLPSIHVGIQYVYGLRREKSWLTAVSCNYKFLTAPFRIKVFLILKKSYVTVKVLIRQCKCRFQI